MTYDTRFFGHPRGLATLFFTEMWERFSFYGMRALLILFMTASGADGGLGFDVAKSGAIYGLYTAMVYMSALPGGWLADRILGQRRAVLYGGMIIALGHFSMALPRLSSFYLGLVLIVIGTGLLKPNISTMVGQLYGPDDARRDAGFSIFYMGINLGAFLAPLACGYVGQRINWHYGFGLAGVGMTAGIVQYVLGAGYVGEAGLYPARPEGAIAAARQKQRVLIGLITAVAAGVLLVVFSAKGLLTARGIADASGVMLLLIVVVFFGWMFSSSAWAPVEKRRLTVIAVLFVASVIFWAIFEQAGSTLNLFAARSVRNRLFGFEFPASWYQAINSMFIISLAPVLAWLWVRLGRRDPSSPVKFAFGLLCAGLGFLVMTGASSVAATGVKVSPSWLLVTYFFHTVGELCLSPVGLSAMTKLAPARVTSLMMGVWFLSLSVGNYLGGLMASLYESFSLTMLFGTVAAFAIGAAAVLWALAGPIKKLMGGVK